MTAFFFAEKRAVVADERQGKSLSEQMKAKASKKKQKRANRQKHFSPCTTFATYEQSK